MFDVSPHFLDSNILLGKILPKNDDNISILPKEDNHSICQLYFEYECERYISKRVKEESLNVVNRLRRISLKLLDHVQIFAETNYINPIKIDFIIHSLKKEFLNKYKDEDYPEGVKKEKFNNIVNDLFVTFDNVFREELLGYNNKIEDFKKDTIGTFRIYSKNLSNLFNSLNIGEFYKEGENSQYEGDIHNLGIHHSDKLILLDCYYLAKNKLKSNVAFITQDKVIVSNKSKRQ